MQMANVLKEMNLLAGSAKSTESCFLMESWFMTEKSMTSCVPTERLYLSRRGKASAPDGKELAPYRSLMGRNAQRIFYSFTCTMTI